MTEQRWEISRTDGAWPSGIEQLAHPPEVIYGIGDLSILQKPCISIIGSRKATPYGCALAKMAGRIAAECSVVCVSGGARGCDIAALRAAYESGGEICVIPGCGADVIYPQSSSDIFNAARSGIRGCVISLEAWGTPPLRYAFPRRNHIIAAISQVLIVTEAAQKSGTMSTVETAAALGRTIYACPGSIFSPLSTGVNALIADGAAMICSEIDLETRISMDYGCLRLSAITNKPTTLENRVLSALIASPMRPDDLARNLDEPVFNILQTLGDYELEGWVVRMIDGRYSPTEELLMYNQQHTTPSKRV